MTHDPHRHHHAKAVTDASFVFDVLRADVPVLVDFYADWCGACQKLAPVLDDLASDYVDRVNVTKVDVERYPGLAERFGVRGIPTLILFDQGEARWSLVNVVAKPAIADKLDETLEAREATS